MKFALPLLAALIAASGFADNLVPEAKRAFEVPFKGEGKMGLVYTPVFFPKGSEGAVISLEAKITDVVRGSQNWFDARVMSDFIDSSCKKVAGGPVIGGWKGTKDWFSVRKSVRIPSGAAGIALMPCLFNVKSGAFEVRNLSVVAQEKYEELPEEKEAREAAEAKRSADWEKRKARAKERLDKNGTLITAQDGAYAKLVSKEPGKLVNAYKEYDVPSGVEAMKVSWKWEVKNLRTGDKPWFDARVLFKFKDASGKEVNSPGPVYVQHDTNGWQERETSFMVPPEAVTFVVMPCLFQVKAGEMEMRDVRCVATSTPQGGGGARAPGEGARCAGRAREPREVAEGGARFRQPARRSRREGGVASGRQRRRHGDDS